MIQTVGFTPTKSQPFQKKNLELPDPRELFVAEARLLAERAGRGLPTDLRSINNLRTVGELLTLGEMAA
jgi:hypothetical protein